MAKPNSAAQHRTQIQDATKSVFSIFAFFFLLFLHLREVLLSLKQLNGLVEQKAKQTQVVGCCKEVVTNMNALQNCAKDTKFEPVIIIVEEFKEAVSKV